MTFPSVECTLLALGHREDLPNCFVELFFENLIYGCGGGFIGLTYCQSVLLLLLLLSAFSDLETDRIPNGFILLGIVIGVLGSIFSDRELSDLLASMLLAFLLMYPLYMIGALGAGDVKLFVMIGSFQPVGELLAILVGAFVIGAGFSLAKLAAEKNGRERFPYFFVYMHDIWRTGHWKIYGEDLKRDYHTYCKNKIHFAVPILFSAVCRIGGLL